VDAAAAALPPHEEILICAPLRPRGSEDDVADLLRCRVFHVRQLLANLRGKSIQKVYADPLIGSPARLVAGVSRAGVAASSSQRGG